MCLIQTTKDGLYIRAANGETQLQLQKCIENVNAEKASFFPFPCI